MCYLGIDIGGSYIKYAYVNEEYKIIKQWKKPTYLCASVDDFYDYICMDIELTRIMSVAISAPGVIDVYGNVKSKAAINVQIMYKTNIIEEIEKRTNLATFVLNDAKAAGYWEFQKGNGKGSKSSVYFIIGTGIGGCICDENGVINGVDGMAGEFSQLPIHYCGKESKQMAEYASMQALIQLYKEKSGGLLKDGKTICACYHNNENVAIEAIDEWCQNICHSLHTIILFYNPEVICIGGGISEEDWFIEKVCTTFDAMKIGMIHLATTRIEQCKYHNDANILGAVLYAKNRSKDTKTSLEMFEI